MSESVSRAAIRALLPEGSLWVPEDGLDLDLQLDGMGANLESIREFLANLAYVRSPELTAILSDLEKEFGLLPDAALTETESRARLASAKTANKGNGTADFMQDKLQASGFDVQVHENNPPVDPADFILIPPTEMTGRTATMTGRDTSMSGSILGALIINGKDDDGETPLPGSGDDEYWPLIFFVGGDATRDPVTDELTAIATASVAASRRDELVQLIVKYKPLHTWCGLIATYT